MKSQLTKKLFAYSSLSGAMVMGTSLAIGQIVYTDPPDIVLTGNDSYELDLNNDGIIELTFLTYTSSVSAGSILIVDINHDEGMQWVAYWSAYFQIPPVP